MLQRPDSWYPYKTPCRYLNTHVQKYFLKVQLQQIESNGCKEFHWLVPWSSVQILWTESKYGKDLQNLAAYPCRHWSCRETLQSKRNHEAAGECKRDFFVILAIHANDWVTQLPKLLPVSISPQQTSPAQLSHVTVYTPNHLLFFSFQASVSVHEFLNNVIIFTTCLDLIL